MGFPVTNDIFARNAWYFRNALVRANYNNWNKGIQGTTAYLELFLKNLLAREHNDLKNRYLHVQWDDKKQDIAAEKQDIDKQKQDIVIPEDIRPKTARGILTLFDHFGYGQIFGRTLVMETLHITASPASALISKMLGAGLIVPVSGHGKGRYRFAKSAESPANGET